MQLEIIRAAKQEVAHRGEHKTKGHKFTGITTIRHNSHEKLAYAIGNRGDRQDASNHRVGVAKPHLQLLGDHREVIAHQVKSCISQEGRLHHPPAKTRVEAFDLVLRQPFNVFGRREKVSNF